MTRRNGRRHTRTTSVGLASLVAILVLAVAACGDDAGDPSGRTWLLTEMDGSPALAGTQVTISFGDGSVTGSGGCNTFTGSATWDGGDFALGEDTVATKIACDGPIMDQEQAFLAMLAAADGYEVDGDELRLLEGGEVIARFTSSAP